MKEWSLWHRRFSKNRTKFILLPCINCICWWPVQHSTMVFPDIQKYMLSVYQKLSLVQSQALTHFLFKCEKSQDFPLVNDSKSLQKNKTPKQMSRYSFIFVSKNICIAVTYGSIYDENLSSVREEVIRLLCWQKW